MDVSIFHDRAIQRCHLLGHVRRRTCYHRILLQIPTDLFSQASKVEGRLLARPLNGTLASRVFGATLHQCLNQQYRVHELLFANFLELGF